MAENSYFDEQKQLNTALLREQIKDLPPFIKEYFVSIAQTNAVKTRLGYARDIKVFFNYLLANHENFIGRQMKDIKVTDLDSITPEDIDIFMEFISSYSRPDEKTEEGVIEYTNDEKGKARKLAALRSMYKYFVKRRKIATNPAALVDSLKIHRKAIVRLDFNEVADLLDEVEYGNDLTERQKMFHEKLKTRDLAIVTLLVGTGMRVSECVGININDVDFKNNGVKITRKGGNESTVYFGEEVEEALRNYLEERKNAVTEDPDEQALFLSSKGKRINVRSVQLLVKKYSSVSVKLKKITPHKLRSTYGSNLYQETGDIYLVADVLGHADVNTTRKHYADIEENRRRSAAKYVKLRND
ncbi:MAG: tyrosine-type recombinase/integrase [Firmicutes bacterium]|nr:tyrosine-type recombinase/integrase [Bacillota bacterium]